MKVMEAISVKKFIKILLFFGVLLLIGCSVRSEEYFHTHDAEIQNHLDYLSFEETLLEFATDIVIAQYVGSRSLDEVWMEFEFIVSDRILGDATEQIFVHVQMNTQTHVDGWINELHFYPNDLVFEYDINYLLPLININDPYSNFYRETGEDMFIFVRNIVVDLDDPSNSVMYGDDLDNHVEGMDFDEDTSTEEIILFMEEIAEEIEEERQWERIFIRSDDIEEIILGSPYVWIVEIAEPRRLSDAFAPNPPLRTDLYYINVIHSLKGEVDLRADLGVVFFADTVLPGEQHIVAIAPNREGGTWYRFTSRNSLFRMDQLDEIMSILENHNQNNSNDSSIDMIENGTIDDYLTFEEALGYASDAVITQFIDYTVIGEGLIKFEFRVLESLLNEITDRIFVYLDGDFGNFGFSYEVEYLLPLIRVESNYSMAKEDEFVFIRSIVIDLNNLSNSIMYNEPLFEHSNNFHGEMMKEEILTLINEHVIEGIEDSDE